MSSVYKPDNWVVIKIKAPTETFYKVLGGWSGGYLDGDSWRMNSGVIEIEEDNDFYYFYGSSGSCYTCNKSSYGLKLNNAHVWESLSNRAGDKVELMLEDTDWMNTTWQIEDK